MEWVRTVSGVARVGIDSAGGIIITGSSNVFVDGVSAARVGDPVQGHGNGEHAGPVLATGSSTVFVNGIQLIS